MMKTGMQRQQEHMDFLLRCVIVTNPFSINVLIIYPLKTENLWFFRGYRSGTLVENELITDEESIPKNVNAL